MVGNSRPLIRRRLSVRDKRAQPNNKNRFIGTSIFQCGHCYPAEGKEGVLTFSYDTFSRASFTPPSSASSRVFGPAPPSIQQQLDVVCVGKKGKMSAKLCQTIMMLQEPFRLPRPVHGSATRGECDIIFPVERRLIRSHLHFGQNQPKTFPPRSAKRLLEDVVEWKHGILADCFLSPDINRQSSVVFN